MNQYAQANHLSDTEAEELLEVVRIADAAYMKSVNEERQSDG